MAQKVSGSYHCGSYLSNDFSGVMPNISEYIKIPNKNTCFDQDRQSQCFVVESIISHNKTLAAQLYPEFKGFFPENEVEYFVNY